MVAVLAKQGEIILRASDRLGMSPRARSGVETPVSDSGKFAGLLGGWDDPPAA